MARGADSKALKDEILRQRTNPAAKATPKPERIQGYFPPDMAQELRFRAVRERRRISTIIVEAVEQYLAKAR